MVGLVYLLGLHKIVIEIVSLITIVDKIECNIAKTNLGWPLNPNYKGQECFYSKKLTNVSNRYFDIKIFICGSC